MAKRDKNRSYDEWEDDWVDYSPEDAKKERQLDRKAKRNQKYTTTDDWDDID